MAKKEIDKWYMRNKPKTKRLKWKKTFRDFDNKPIGKTAKYALHDRKKLSPTNILDLLDKGF